MYNQNQTRKHCSAPMLRMVRSEDGIEGVEQIPLALAQVQPTSVECRRFPECVVGTRSQDLNSRLPELCQMRRLLYGSEVLESTTPRSTHIISSSPANAQRTERRINDIQLVLESALEIINDSSLSSETNRQMRHVKRNRIAMEKKLLQ